MVQQIKPGKTVIPFSLNSVYSVISSGTEKYYMIYNNQEIDIEQYYEQNIAKNH